MCMHVCACVSVCAYARMCASNLCPLLILITLSLLCLSPSLSYSPFFSSPLSLLLPPLPLLPCSSFLSPDKQQLA